MSVDTNPWCVVLTEGDDLPEVYGPFDTELQADNHLALATCEGYVARMRPGSDLR